MHKVVFTALLSVIGISSLGMAFAAEYVSIVPSRMCEITNCITIEELMDYDNSYQLVSGKFVFNNETGDYERQKGLRTSFEFYRLWPEELVIFVTPDDYTYSRTKQVIIEPSLEEFIMPSQHKKTQVDDYTDIRHTSYGMYANGNCSTVTIGIKQVNVTEALDYLLNGCIGGQNPHVTEFKTEKTQIDYCGLDCQHKKFLEEALKQTKEFQLRKK